MSNQENVNVWRQALTLERVLYKFGRDLIELGVFVCSEGFPPKLSYRKILHCGIILCAS